MYNWHRQYQELGEDAFCTRRSKYSDEEKRRAVDHFFEHGRCLARTMGKLGYPRSHELLAKWIMELEPERASAKKVVQSFSFEQKKSASIFAASKRRYGYRRIRLALKDGGITISEKVICRIMKEDGLIAKRGKRRSYSSYVGEPSEAPGNIAKRRFHSTEPNRLWLTRCRQFQSVCQSREIGSWLQRNIESRNPARTAAEFAGTASKGAVSSIPIEGKGMMSLMRDGSVVLHRYTSRDGSPVVELKVKNTSGIRSQNIHFTRKGK